MKHTVREVTQIIIMMAMMQVGFLATYAYLWYVAGLPMTVWAIVVVVTISGATNWLYVKWVGGNQI